MNIDESQIRHDGNCVRVTIEEIVAKNGREYIFVDDFFEYDDGLHGATHTGVMGVTEEWYEERVEEFRDYEWSPMAHIYDEQNTPKGWDEWIDEVIRHDAPEIIVDPSGGKYYDTVKEKFEEETGQEMYLTDCVSGGRMSGMYDRGVDTIYNQELWAAVQDVEENGLENIV